MKRIALLVGVLAMTAAANAQDAEFKNGGEFRVRYENDVNRTGQEAGLQQANTHARMKWNVTARKGEKTQAFLSLIHNSQFGTGTGGTNGTMGAATNVDTTSGTATNQGNSLVVSRAWGWWKASDSVALKVGRMGIEIADGAVFSEDDYFAYPITFEGLNAAFDSGFAAFNFWAVKTAENAPNNNNSDPETNRYILSADLKNMPEVVKMANVHLVQTNADQTAGAGSANWQHLGFTFGGDAGAIMYKATGAFQMGQFAKTAAADQKINANMFDVMVGTAMPETMGLKVSLGYHMDSGNDGAATADKTELYQTLSYDSHNYAGLMDVVQWGNLSYLNLNASIMPAEDLETGIGFYMFSKTKENGGVTAGPGYNGPAAGAKKDLGNEIDLFANKSYGNDMKIGARIGMFMPGAAIKDATPGTDKTLTDFLVQASMGF
ncbi:MAG: alginate export family protein [Bdellovibrionota bacterium]